MSSPGDSERFESQFTGDSSSLEAAGRKAVATFQEVARAEKACKDAAMAYARELELGRKATAASTAAFETRKGSMAAASEASKQMVRSLAEEVTAMRASAAVAEETARRESQASQEAARQTEEAAKRKERAEREAQASIDRAVAEGVRSRERAAKEIERQQRLSLKIQHDLWQQEIDEAKRVAEAKARAEQEVAQRRAQVRQQAPQKLTSFGIAATIGVTAPVAAGFVYASNQAGDFERSMDMLQAGTKATAAQMEAASKKAIELGEDLTLPATSAQDAGRSMLVATRNGLDLANAMEADRGILQLSAAAMLDQARSAELVARTLNAYQLPGSQATKIADLLTAAQTKAGASAEAMALGYEHSASIFHAAHQPLELLTTDLALLIRHGLSGEVAGTSLKNMLIRLENPGTKAAAVIKQLGLHVYDAHGVMKPFNVIVDELGRSLEGYTEKNRNAALATIFGSRSILAANVLVAEGADGYRKMNAELTENGVAARMAGAQMKGLKGAQEALNSATETFALKSGMHWINAEARIIRGTAEWVNAVSDLNPALGATIAITGGAAAAVGPLALGVGQAVIQYRNMKGILDLVRVSKVASTAADTESIAPLAAATAGEAALAGSVTSANAAIDAQIADLTTLNASLDATAAQATMTGGALSRMWAAGGIGLAGKGLPGITGLGGGAGLSILGAAAVAAIPAIPTYMWGMHNLKAKEIETGESQVQSSEQRLKMRRQIGAMVDADLAKGQAAVRESLKALSGEPVGNNKDLMLAGIGSRQMYLESLQSALEKEHKVLTDDLRIVTEQRATAEAMLREKKKQDAVMAEYDKLDPQKNAEMDALLGPKAKRGRRGLNEEQTRNRDLARSIAVEKGISPDLFLALIKQESGFNTHARSKVGAMGLGQLMPGTAAGLGVKNAWDPEQNLEGSATLIRRLLQKYRDPRLALAAYNAGEGAVDKYHGVPPYAETQKYVRAIMGSLGVGASGMHAEDGLLVANKSSRETSQIRADQTIKSLYRDLDILKSGTADYTKIAQTDAIAAKAHQMALDGVNRSTIDLFKSLAYKKAAMLDSRRQSQAMAADLAGLRSEILKVTHASAEDQVAWEKFKKPFSEISHAQQGFVKERLELMKALEDTKALKAADDAMGRYTDRMRSTEDATGSLARSSLGLSEEVWNRLPTEAQRAAEGLSVYGHAIADLKKKTAELATETERLAQIKDPSAYAAAVNKIHDLRKEISGSVFVAGMAQTQVTGKTGLGGTELGGIGGLAPVYGEAVDKDRDLASARKGLADSSGAIDAAGKGMAERLRDALRDWTEKGIRAFKAKSNPDELAETLEKAGQAWDEQFREHIRKMQEAHLPVSLGDIASAGKAREAYVGAAGLAFSEGKADELQRSLEKEVADLRLTVAGYQSLEDQARAAFQAELDRAHISDEATRKRLMGLEEEKLSLQRLADQRNQIVVSITNAGMSAFDALLHPPKRDTSGLRSQRTDLQKALADLDRRYATGIQDKETQAAFDHDRKMLTTHLNQIEGELKRHGNSVGAILQRVGSVVTQSFQKMIEDLERQQVEKAVKKAAEHLVDDIWKKVDPKGYKKAHPQKEGKAEQVANQKVTTARVEEATYRNATFQKAIIYTTGGGGSGSSGQTSGQFGGVIDWAQRQIGGGFFGGLFNAGLTAYGAGGFSGGGSGGGSLSDLGSFGGGGTEAGPMDAGFAGGLFDAPSFAVGGFPAPDRPFLAHDKELIHPMGQSLQVHTKGDSQRILAGVGGPQTVIYDHSQKHYWSLDAQAAREIRENNMDRVTARRAIAKAKRTASKERPQ